MPDENKVESINATEEVASALQKYVELRQQKKLIEDQMLQYRSVVEEYIGDKSVLLSSDGMKKLASYAYGKPKTIVDMEGVVKELQAMYTISDDIIKHVKDEYTVIERGARSFRV
jgi:hypothetical protein